jgi:hypothetical protein
MNDKGCVAIEGAADGRGNGVGLRLDFDRRLKLEFHCASVTLFGRVLDRIARLRPPDPAPC